MKLIIACSSDYIITASIPMTVLTSMTVAVVAALVGSAVGNGVRLGVEGARVGEVGMLVSSTALSVEGMDDDPSSSPGPSTALGMTMVADPPSHFDAANHLRIQRCFIISR